MADELAPLDPWRILTWPLHHVRWKIVAGTKVESMRSEETIDLMAQADKAERAAKRKK